MSIQCRFATCAGEASVGFGWRVNLPNKEAAPDTSELLTLGAAAAAATGGEGGVLVASVAERAVFPAARCGDETPAAAVGERRAAVLPRTVSRTCASVFSSSSILCKSGERRNNLHSTASYHEQTTIQRMITS